jgi:hypothetical protein
MMKDLDNSDSGGRETSFGDRDDNSDSRGERDVREPREREVRDRERVEETRDPDLKETIEIDYGGRDVFHSKNQYGLATGDRADGFLEGKATGSGGELSLLNDRATQESPFKLLDNGESLYGGQDRRSSEKEKFLEVDIHIGVLDATSSWENPQYNELRIQGNWHDGYKAEGDLVRAAAIFFGAYKEAKDYKETAETTEKVFDGKITKWDAIKFAIEKGIKPAETAPNADQVNREYWSRESNRNVSRGFSDTGYSLQSDRTERILWGDRSNLLDLDAPGRSFK